MATKKCSKLANIIAVKVVAWDDELAQEIARLSNKKQDALVRSRGLKDKLAEAKANWKTAKDIDELSWWTAHELELKAASADMELRAIVQATVLEWTMWEEAMLALAKEITKSWGNIAWWVTLLDKLGTMPIKDYSDVARLWSWGKWNVEQTIKEIKQSIAQFTSSNYSILKYADFVDDEMSTLKKQLKQKTITNKQFEKKVKDLHKTIMKKIEAWENPTHFVKLDKEWQQIKKVFGENPREAWKAWTQFIMARELLADWEIDEWVMRAFASLWWENLAWDLTIDQISKCKSLDKLLARAYTNTKQLYSDWALRQVYKDKLVQLASGMKLDDKNLKKVKSIMKTIEFAEEWVTFSAISRRSVAYDTARRIGLKMDKVDSTVFYNSLTKYLEKLYKADFEIWTWPINIAWVEMRAQDVITILYELTWDENIVKLVNGANFSDWEILSIATQRFLWDDANATKGLMKLIEKGRGETKMDNIRNLELRAMCWIDIADWKKVSFFDSRSSLYHRDELNSDRAKLMDKLADKNKMRVDSSDINNITPIEDFEDPEDLANYLEQQGMKWWYLIVRDAKWQENEVLRKAINKFKWNDAITVLAPNGGMSAWFVWENGWVYYKTMSDSMFDRVSWTISIQSLWEAKPTRAILEASEWVMSTDPVEVQKAMAKYYKELNDAAITYFGKMLWLSQETIDEEYVKRVQTLLSEKTWIEYEAFNKIKNKSELWQKIDKKFTLDKITAWKYDKDIVDINKIKTDIDAMSDEMLADNIKRDLGNLVDINKINGNENIAWIREAYLDFKTAPDAATSLSAKGRIISLTNWVNPQEISITQLQDMFQHWTFSDVYKTLFFGDVNVDEKEMALFIKEINDDIFDSLSIWFAENLVDAWYSLPLINIKNFVYDFLRWKVDLNSPFVQAFFFKNWIAFTEDNIHTIISTLMPSGYKLDYETSLLRWRFNTNEPAGLTSVFVEKPNRFIDDSYSALAAIEHARAGDLVTAEEKKVLEQILDKYIEAVKEWVNNKTLDFRWAQELKQEASYALDMFEQDYLMPRYGKFLTPQQKQSLMGMKYSLPIWVAWQDYNALEKELTNTKKRIMDNYTSTIGSTAKNNDINMKLIKWYDKKKEWAEMTAKIEERRKQLAQNWWIIREVDWQFLVFDSRDALWQALDTLPAYVEWLSWLKALGREWLNDLTNKQVYTLLRYIEATRALATSANYTIELMYKQNPQLLQYRFFDTYKVGDNWIPRALEWNALNQETFFDNVDNIAGIDRDIKQDIFSDIIKEFKEKKFIAEDRLDEIIEKAITRQTDDLKVIQMPPKKIQEAKAIMKKVYTNSFIPYTYLRDLPTWWTFGKVKVTNMKEKVASAMRQQYNQAMDDLRAVWINDLDEIWQKISIRLKDGTVVSVKDLSDMNIDRRKKDIFNNEIDFIAAADDDITWAFKIEDNRSEEKKLETRRQEKEYKSQIVNSYNSTLQAMLNQTQVITEAERKAMVAFMNDVRSDLRQYTLTNMLVDALDSVSWLNEEAARWIKQYLIWWKSTILFWTWKPDQIMTRYGMVKEAYERYYDMTLNQLARVKPTNQAEKLAMDIARYFKNLERLLWSVDWTTWVTTDAAVNRAFYHIGETFMNISDDPTKWVKQIFWMLSAIEQNQILKFFKYSKQWSASYVDMFFRSSDDVMWWLGWYRDYVEKINNITRDDWNRLFWTNFNEDTFKRAMQALSWFTYLGDWWARNMTKVLDVLNWSYFIFRFLMSYPGQLLTIPQQWVAYFLKQIWFEKELWIDDMAEIDDVRESFWILDWAYNELFTRRKTTFNPDSKNPNTFYNRYWIPDIKEVYKNTGISTSDDYINMYAKVDTKFSSEPSWVSNAARWLDPYKDNANNFIDWMFARNFKNIAFMKAIKGNDFIQFSSAKAFRDFMNRADIDAWVKSKLLDRVSAYSGRNFRNILWLGFWWLDRPVSWRWRWNILYGIMQMFNFRWAWWQNIFKQTWAQIYNSLVYLWRNPTLSPTARNELARAIATSPEFLNFTTAVFNDLKWSWRLQRFQDNGRWPDQDDDWNGLYGVLDFLDYFRETLNMTSQWYQWLQSFWPFRPFDEMASSALDAATNPTIYKDTYGIWALFNAIGKNFGRQWKPWKWIAQAFAAFMNSPADGWAFLENKWRELSFWSLRYMVNEDLNSYWYTYEVSWQYGGIPWIVMGETRLGSDKSFMYQLDNNETWETLKILWDPEVSNSDKWTYRWNLLKAFLNGSQFFSMLRYWWKWITRSWPSYFTFDELAETITKTPAWDEFYRQGYVTPKTRQEASIFFKTILNHSQYRPGSQSFNKSVMQFDEWWHMDWKKWNKADAEMELWLNHMKYLTDVHWEYVKDWKQKVIDESWTKLMTNIKANYGNQDYVTKTIRDYCINWLNVHDSDPNYQLYVKLLWQWQANELIKSEITKRVAERNAWLAKEWKWSETEFKNWEYDDLLLELWNSMLPWVYRTFFDVLNELDEDDATLAAIQIIKDEATEEDQKTLEKFFTVTTWDDGVESVDFKPQYKSVMTQIGSMARASDEWNVERLIAEASSLANTFKDTDPTWAITASMIDSLFNRIYDSPNLSAKQKQELMIAIFHDNKEFMQKNPEQLRKYMWDDYDEYADLTNQMLYRWDWQLISNLESMQAANEADAKGAKKKAESLSNEFKDWSLKLWWTWGSGYGRTWSRWWGAYWKWVPVVIKWADLVKDLWLKWYTPINVKYVVNPYKSHTRLTIWKDVNRNVNWPKTQAISNKKQISDIEKKTTKALEAES